MALLVRKQEGEAELPYNAPWTIVKGADRQEVADHRPKFNSPLYNKDVPTLVRLNAK
jgi:hypothetical protein